MKISNNKLVRPSITVNGLRKGQYAYQVNLVHPVTKEPIGSGSHIFRKNDKTPDPKEAAYQFAQVMMSPSVTVKDVVRIVEYK